MRCWDICEDMEFKCWGIFYRWVLISCVGGIVRVFNEDLSGEFWKWCVFFGVVGVEGLDVLVLVG